jgi:hypothetical protein
MVGAPRRRQRGRVDALQRGRVSRQRASRAARLAASMRSRRSSKRWSPACVARRGNCAMRQSHSACTRRSKAAAVSSCSGVGFMTVSAKGVGRWRVHVAARPAARQGPAAPPPAPAAPVATAPAGSIAPRARRAARCPAAGSSPSQKTWCLPLSVLSWYWLKSVARISSWMPSLANCLTIQSFSLLNSGVARLEVVVQHQRLAGLGVAAVGVAGLGQQLLGVLDRPALHPCRPTSRCVTGLWKPCPSREPNRCPAAAACAATPPLCLKMRP